MRHRLLLISLLAAITSPAAAQAPKPAAPAATPKPPPKPTKVYGEWRIHIRPDRGRIYNELIRDRGLPLFREAGGRMVGWWTTQVGDLYEHLTIWEYDGMAAYEKAGQFLGKDDRFAQFVALRDPLLAGEESRFLRLAPGAEPPTLPDPAKLVIHEVHRVPLQRMEAYRKFIEREALPVWKSHGFRPVGPWIVEVGNWSEATYLFRYESLAERERLIGAFDAHPDGPRYAQRLNDFVSEITTRVLAPAPFAR